MLVSLTVGKVDAGVAVLLTEDKRLIEFPSILLPPTISSGSIVDIHVSRNTTAEQEAAAAFQSLQRSILATFGTRNPVAPILRVRNATQTSIVLEWEPLELASAALRSLSLYRNGAKAGAIPRPLEIRATKISGLVVDKEYAFHLVLRTSAGTYASQRVAVRTHKMTDLSGITITPGPMPAALRGSLEASVERIGARLADEVRIDTTHFVCTEGRGQAWEKAVEMNVPVVVPDWIKGCEREGRIVGVRGYYLNADPRLRQVGPGVAVQQQQQQEQHQQQQQTQQRQSQQLPSRSVEDVADKKAGAPTPPAKDGAGTSVGDRQGDEGRSSGESSTLAEAAEPKSATEEQKVRRDDFKPAGQEDGDSDTSEETEADATDRGVADSPPSANGATADAQNPEDSASFHEVAL